MYVLYIAILCKVKIFLSLRSKAHATVSTRRRNSLLCCRVCPKVLGQRRFDRGSMPLSCLKDSSSAGQMWKPDVDREKAVGLMPSKHILPPVQSLQINTDKNRYTVRPADKIEKTDNPQIPRYYIIYMHSATVIIAEVWEDVNVKYNVAENLVSHVLGYN